MSAFISRRIGSGFTLPELLILLIVGTLVAGCADRSLTERDAEREATTIANLATIRTALERYHTDFEEYPEFLIGGDKEGWSAWHKKWDEPYEIGPPVPPPPHLPVETEVLHRHLRDPLLSYGYLDTYPANPFVDDGAVVKAAASDDPRFGSAGAMMGNTVDDPCFTQPGPPWSQVDFDLMHLQSGRPAQPSRPQGYAQGGRRVVRDTDGGPVVDHVGTWWPGTFCYRAGIYFFSRKGYYVWYPGQYVGGESSRYLLVVFGATSTPGRDLIRLEARDPSGQQLYYRFPPPWSGSNQMPLGIRDPSDWKKAFGLPEVFGGGNAWQAPWFPYNRSLDYPNAWIYGAPDGVPDGIIEVITSGVEVQTW